MKEVVLDTETTGLSVKDGHRIVEIGCLELENLIPTNNKFHCYLNPERKVSEKALAVHGYSDEFLSKQKKFNEVGEEFLQFIKDKRLIIHNAEFDISHIDNELNLFGKNKIDNEIVDTLILARDKFPGSPVSLDALCKRFRIDNSNLKKIIKIVHKEIRNKLQFFLNKNKNKKFVVLDIPLLLENKINKKKDILVYVDSRKNVILRNLKKRRNFNPQILKKFKEIQLPLAYKKKISKYIINNKFTKKSVKSEIKKILEIIKNERSGS